MLAAAVGAVQPRKLPPARRSPLRSQVRSRRGAGPAESPAEQQGRVEGECPALPPLWPLSLPKMPLCDTVLFLSRVNKDKKKLGKHTLCCLAIYKQKSAEKTFCFCCSAAKEPVALCPWPKHS